MNARFRPSAYRDMHCGHAYMTYHNWETARLTGGEFVVIFDDTIHEMVRLDRQGFTMEVAAERWLEDLSWLGFAPDRVAFASYFEEERREVLSRLGLRMPMTVGIHAGIDRFIPPPYPIMHKGGWYSDAIVVSRVVDDRCLGIEAFWRGMELKGEEQLYDHFGHLLGYPQVAQGYLPTVGRKVDEKLSQSSQDLRVATIRRLRERGYEPWQIIGTLLECERRSQEEALAQIIIPPEYLNLEDVAWLEFRGDPKYIEGIVVDLEGQPWEETVRAWVREQEAGLKPWWPPKTR